MAVSRAERLQERLPRIIATFGADENTLRVVSDLLTLLEMAWHECYGDVTPPEEVIDNVLLCSEGTLAGLITAATLAVIDHRDLSVWAAGLQRTY